MGYSRSKRTLLKLQPLLSELEAGKDARWNLASGMSPEMFAYKVREALYVASLFPNEFPQLAEAHRNFKVEIVDRSTVQAVFKPHLGGTGGVEKATVTHGLQDGGVAPNTLAGHQTAESVIAAWHAVQPSNTPMKFPQARMSKEELTKLYQWCGERTPPWYMFVDINGGLVLRPKTADLEGLNWDPSDED